MINICIKIVYLMLAWLVQISVVQTQTRSFGALENTSSAFTHLLKTLSEDVEYLVQTATNTITCTCRDKKPAQVHKLT